MQRISSNFSFRTIWPGEFSSRFSSFACAFICLIILLSVPSQGVAQKKRPSYTEIPCSYYWVGSMKQTYDPYTGITIKRKRKKQIEILPITGEKRIWKVEWVDDCEYHLTFKKSTLPTKLRKGWIKKVQIVDCYKEFYNWDADINGIKSVGTIEKVLTKSEQKKKDRLEAKERAEFVRDSINMAIEDSLAIARGEDPVKLRKEREMKEKAEAEAKAAAKKGEEGKKEGEEEIAENKEAEESGEEDAEGDEKSSKGKKKKDKKKKEKKKKEKKEKPPKEKKEKAPKEKKEKVPKEKKEKPPKEKKEKDDKED